MFPFNATVLDVSPSLFRRRVADCYDHMETRLYEHLGFLVETPNYEDLKNLTSSLKTSLLHVSFLALATLARFIPTTRVNLQ